MGTAETAYAASNAAQFLTEIDDIDAADDLAANTAADDGLALTTTLTGDEAIFEETLSPAGAGYQRQLKGTGPILTEAGDKSTLSLCREPRD